MNEINRIRKELGLLLLRLEVLERETSKNVELGGGSNHASSLPDGEPVGLLWIVNGQHVTNKPEAKQEEEWPKVGDEYWYTDYIQSLRVRFGRDVVNDNGRLSTGNICRTKGEADSIRDWLTNPRTQARRQVEMCEGFGHGWEITLNAGQVAIWRIVSEWVVGGLIFTTKEQAQACIDTLGEDVIKQALGIEV